MAVRKSGKSALDYDPLSWLKGESNDENSPPTDPVPADADTKEPTQAEEISAPLTAENAASPANTFHDRRESTTKNVATGPGAAESQAREEAVDARSDISTQYLPLDPELTMKNVAEFKQQFDYLMQKDAPIAIDAGELRKIDSAGLQLLYSLQRVLEKNGSSVIWKQENQVIKTAAAIIGMELNVTIEKSDTSEIEAEQGWGFF